MEYRLLLIYDRKEADPINYIAQVLVNAEADFILPVLNTSIEFTIYTDNGDNELEWVIKKMLDEVSEVAYVKIYHYLKSWGPGKKYNPSAPDEAVGYIGKTLDEYLLAARVNPHSFRKEYTKLKNNTKSFKQK